jgi:hypothetical protein
MRKTQGTLYTVDAAARQLAVSPATIKEFIRMYGPSARKNRQPLIALDRIRPWLEDRESARKTFDWFMENCPDD